ncbi:MAG: hypothetical protein U9R28_03055 [Pseudomonadota bacterium]|nr:hypothetical protein [Pseudomonadota bacterium]
MLDGINILATSPIDITGDLTGVSSEQLVYAALTSAIASLASTDEDGTPDLDAVLDLLVESFEGGQILAVDGEDTTLISLQDIITEAQSTLTEAGVSDTSGILDEIQYVIDNTPEGGYIDPEPGDVAIFTEVDQVKILMADLRTWINTVDADINSATSASAFATQVELASDAFGALEGLNNPAVILGESFDTALEYVTEVFKEHLSSPMSLEGFNSFTSGTIAFNPSTGTATITGGVVNGYTVNMTIDGPINKEESDVFEFVLGSSTIANAETALNIASGSVVLYLGDTWTLNYGSLLGSPELGALPRVKNFVLDLDSTLVQKTPDEDVTTFTGVLSSNVESFNVTADGQGNNPFLPTTISLVGSVTDGTEVLDSSWAINFTNLEHVEGLDALDKLDTFVETDLNWIDFNTGLTFESTLTELPTANINVSLNRTALDTADLQTTIRFDDRKLTIASTLDENAEFATAEFTVTNQDGAVLIMEMTESEGPTYTGTLSYNGIIYGTISEDDLGMKISYTDGSFEYY